MVGQAPQRLLVIAIGTIAWTSCNPGTIDTGDDQDASVDAGVDAGGCEAGCPAGQVCIANVCIDEGSDPCLGVTCRTGEQCVGGDCVPVDACEGVTCEEPGEVCQDGVCVPEEQDIDGDGFPAGEDCDDNNAEIHPDADEDCNGLDDDCDDLFDEDLTRSCSTACGEGTELCAGGSWTGCDAPQPDVEVCGNCVDEDCSGVGDTCNDNTISSTSVGGQSYVITACADEAYVCVEVDCLGPSGRVSGAYSGVTGSHCWHFDVTFSSAGRWECTFTRQLDGDWNGTSADCIPDDVVDQACIVLNL